MLCQHIFTYIVFVYCERVMFEADGDVIMLRVQPFTIITCGANGVDWKAETLARH